MQTCGAHIHLVVWKSPCAKLQHQNFGVTACGGQGHRQMHLPSRRGQAIVNRATGLETFRRIPSVFRFVPPHDLFFQISCALVSLSRPKLIIVVIPECRMWHEARRFLVDGISFSTSTAAACRGEGFESRVYCVEAGCWKLGFQLIPKI